MTTYEHGRAPADAPVTWIPSKNYDGAAEIPRGIFTMTTSVEFANDHCRLAHLAALADEVAEGVNEAMIFAAGGEDAVRECKAKDWLRRYRAAKGAP